MMSESDGPWDIRNLADLILGPGNTQPDASAQPNRDCGTDDNSDDVSRCRGHVVLVHPEQNAVEAVTRYADYWSNRGQTVAAVWIGQSGIKFGLFDYLRRLEWATELTDALESHRFDEVAKLFDDSVRQLAIAITMSPGWRTSPFVQRCSSLCVLLEPIEEQLIRSYESLKHMATKQPSCRLSCFVQEALSAGQATELSSRLQNMGDQFLDTDIEFAGFSLSEQWPSSNLVAETFIERECPDGGELLGEVLLGLLGPPHEAPMPENADPAMHEPEMPNSNNRLLAEACPADGFPTALPIRIPHRIRNLADLDAFVEDMIHEVCGQFVECWPVYTTPDSDCRFRWVFRQNGARLIVASSLNWAAGALERAAAYLHPAQADDHIVLLAGNVGLVHRKAAQSLAIPTKLFEISQLPSDDNPTLVLKDVTAAIE